MLEWPIRMHSRSQTSSIWSSSRLPSTADLDVLILTWLVILKRQVLLPLKKHLRSVQLSHLHQRHLRPFHVGTTTLPRTLSQDSSRLLPRNAVTTPPSLQRSTPATQDPTAHRSQSLPSQPHRKELPSVREDSKNSAPRSSTEKLVPHCLLNRICVDHPCILCVTSPGHSYSLLV